MTTTQAEFAIPELQYGLLVAGGNAVGQDAVFTAFGSDAPEPWSLGLAAVGLAGLWIWRRYAP